MFSRRVHLVTLAIIYVALPLLLEAVRHLSNDGISQTFTGFRSFYYFLILMLVIPSIFLTSISCYFYYLGFGPGEVETAREREIQKVFRYAIWKEVHIKYPAPSNSAMNKLGKDR